MNGMTAGNRLIRAAAEQGDYVGAVEMATKLLPDMVHQLQQYRLMMEQYETSRGKLDWRRALRALADARLAAIAAGLVELEIVATNRLYDIVKSHELRRA
ncbi:MAG: hypothetical protein K0R39_2433 [Symbiobacteriaceae bacterium]|jgi:hypothetical protein|nr:hypothetical protein [Symbiobacteriaceae bacterium]